MRECPFCGKDFEPKTFSQKYCNDGCYRAHHKNLGKTASIRKANERWAQDKQPRSKHKDYAWWKISTGKERA